MVNMSSKSEVNIKWYVQICLLFFALLSSMALISLQGNQIQFFHFLYFYTPIPYQRKQTPKFNVIVWLYELYHQSLSEISF